MRRKKENLNLHKSKDEGLDDVEALAEEREERYEQFSGEEATEGVGPGFTEEPELEKSIEGADGPVAGESTDPPLSPQKFGISRSKAKKAKKKAVGRTVPKNAHIAARSSKKI